MSELTDERLREILSIITAALVPSSGGGEEAAFAEYEGITAKELAETVARYGQALGKIASPTQTEGLLWWQIEARDALRGANPSSGGEVVAWCDAATMAALVEGKVGTVYGTKAEGDREIPIYAHAGGEVVDE